MDFLVGSDCSADKNSRKLCNRHNSIQIQLLEAFYRQCPQPNEEQKRQLSRELGLELNQIKFWFQNKRTQMKVQIDRADNSALRAENERIRYENCALQEALRHAICPACGGPTLGKGETNYSLEKLRLENTQLKLERERLSEIIASYTANAQPPAMVSTMYPRNQAAAEAAGGLFMADHDNLLTESLNGLEGAEETPATTNFHYRDDGMEAAASALEELYKLLE